MPREETDAELCLLNFGEQLDEAFLALGLILSGVAFGNLSDIHRTEFRAAHGTELSVLVKIVGQSFVVHAASGFGIERQFKLFVPVEKETRVGKSVVAIASAGAVTSNVGGVSGNFIGDDSLLHVFGVGQAEVFLGRDVAK